jgi:hypothetical protein
LAEGCHLLSIPFGRVDVEIYVDMLERSCVVLLEVARDVFITVVGEVVLGLFKLTARLLR